MRQDILARSLKDKELLGQVKGFVGQERKIQSQLLAHLGEVEHRQLFAVLGYSSMFRYLTEALGYSEASALKRIQIARAAMKFQVIYSLVESGKISLSALMRLCPHLRVSNYQSLLKQAEKKSVKQVEKLLADRFPKPEPYDSIKAIARDRVWFGFCGDVELSQMVEEAKDLLGHKFPEGKLRDIFKYALRCALKEERDKKTKSKIPKAIQQGSRHTPQHIKVAVWERDRSSCDYVSPDGRRCGETRFLEFDHKLPWSLGGRSDDVDNIRLLCRTHNRLMASQVFGLSYIQKKIEEKYSGIDRELSMNRFMLDVWSAGSLEALKRGPRNAERDEHGTGPKSLV